MPFDRVRLAAIIHRRLGLLLGFLALVEGCASAPRHETVTIVAFSDYHSRAVPFHSEGRPRQGGLARAIAYAADAKHRDGAVVVSGGDFLDRGGSAWGDELRCAEWPLFDRVVDVSALGNHELDFGADELVRCRRSIRFPILSANLVDAQGRVIFGDERGRPYVVRRVGGRRIGFFGVAGADTERTMTAALRPFGGRFLPPIETARRIVGILRDVERVDAVVFIGHQDRRDDEAMARAVPGIDLILGSHSHVKEGLTRIEGTDTLVISPFQYLTHLSRVTLRFADGRLAGIEGELVRLDERLPEDPAAAFRVERLERELRTRRPERFAVVGRAAVTLDDDGVKWSESVVSNWVMDELRRAAGTHAFFSTASLFRGAIPEGEVTLEALVEAVPYDDPLVVVEMSGRELEEWLRFSVAQRGLDSFSSASGVRYRVAERAPAEIEILRDPNDAGAGFVAVDPDARYLVGTTSFQATVATGYRELAARCKGSRTLDRTTREVLLAALAAAPIRAFLDGRVLDAAGSSADR